MIAADWDNLGPRIKELRGDIGGAHDPLAGMVAPEPSKPRPPPPSVLTAHFADLDNHPAFAQRFNATRVAYGLARTRDKHSRGPIQGML